MCDPGVYLHLFVVGIAWPIEVSWIPVHMQRVHVNMVFFDINVHICEHIRRVCTCARVSTVCSLVLKDEGGEVWLVYTEHLSLATGAFFDIKRDRCVLYDYFLTRVEMNVCVCVCIRTHTHTAHGVFNVNPDGNLDGPNPDGLNLGIHIFVYVYKVHMWMHMLWGEIHS